MRGLRVQKRVDIGGDKRVERRGDRSIRAVCERDSRDKERFTADSSESANMEPGNRPGRQIKKGQG